MVANQEEKRMAERTGVSVEQLRKEKAEFDKIVAGTATPAEAKKMMKAVDKAEKKEAKAQAKAKKSAKKAKVKIPTIHALAQAKIRYKEKGDASNCGDWLALTLRDAFITKVKGKKVFDMEGFVDCLRENEVDISGPWAKNRSKGWQGRFRMNGRQKLEIALAKEGHIVLAGKKMKPTGTFLKAMEKAHKTAVEAAVEAEE
jgi:hypothetical protein